MSFSGVSVVIPLYKTFVAMLNMVVCIYAQDYFIRLIGFTLHY
jgi:hypothetical protein